VGFKAALIVFVSAKYEPNSKSATFAYSRIKMDSGARFTDLGILM
jgi:hypothetical protein